MRAPVSRALVTCFENGQVVLPELLDCAALRERLFDLGARQKSAAFELRRGGLWAKNSVGVVQCGSLTIEILPKTANRNPAIARSFLSDLLRWSRSSKQLLPKQADVAQGEDSAFEAILAWALAEAQTALLAGIPRRYEPRTEFSAAVRGHVEMAALAQSRPGKRFEVKISHAPLTDENLVGLLIRWALGRIATLTRNGDRRRLALGLLSSSGGAHHYRPEMADWDHFALRAMEADWAPFLQFARSLLEMRLPNPVRGGTTPGVALLFTLHDLFEGALRRIFQAGLSTHGLALGRASKHLLYSACSPKQRPLISLRPDYSFRTFCSGSLAAVGDAKWKRLFGLSSQPSMNEADGYQLASYMTALAAPAGLIFSPLDEGSSSPLRTSRWYLTGSDAPVTIVGIDVATLVRRDAGGAALRSDLCSLVFGATASLTT